MWGTIPGRGVARVAMNRGSSAISVYEYSRTLPMQKVVFEVGTLSKITCGEMFCMMGFLRT